jgi:hypothetical protein
MALTAFWRMSDLPPITPTEQVVKLTALSHGAG